MSVTDFFFYFSIWKRFIFHLSGNLIVYQPTNLIFFLRNTLLNSLWIYQAIISVSKHQMKVKIIWINNELIPAILVWYANFEKVLCKKFANIFKLILSVFVEIRSIFFAIVWASLAINLFVMLTKNSVFTLNCDRSSKI